MAEYETMTDDFIDEFDINSGEERIIRHWSFGWDWVNATGYTGYEKFPDKYGFGPTVETKKVKLDFVRYRSIPNYAKLVEFERDWKYGDLSSISIITAEDAARRKAILAKAQLLAGEDDLRLSSLRNDLKRWDDRPKPGPNKPGMQYATKPRVALEAFLKKALEERIEKERIEKIHKMAEQGDADAQYELGLYYKDGKGKDPTKAIEYIKKAAEQGNSNANDYLTKFANETISGFNTAKDYLPTSNEKLSSYSADYFVEKEKIFTRIENTLKLLPVSFGVQSQIDECETIRKQCGWAEHGLCWYCGGKLSLFTTKCKVCGKKN